MRTLARAFVPSMTAASLFIACGHAAAAPLRTAMADAQALTATGLSGMAQSVQVEDRSGVLSQAEAVLNDGQRLRFVMRNQIIVKTESGEALRAAVDSMASRYPGLTVDFPIAGGQYWAVSAKDVGTAMSAAEALNRLLFVDWAMVDRSTPSRPGNQNPNAGIQQIMLERAAMAMQAPGVAWPPSGGQRGGLDPQVPNQWHLGNAINFGRDNNIIPVFDDGVTGNGIVMSLSNVERRRFDSAHRDLVDRFLPNLSDTPNQFVGPDAFDTLYAGLMVATAGNGFDGQGVAPGAQIAALIRGTPLLEAAAYEQKNIPVRFHPMRFTTAPFDSYGYGVPDDRYNGANFYRFVQDALLNSQFFGRERKGVVHVFNNGTNSSFPFPPEFGGGGWDDLLAGNEVAVSVTNGYTVGPNYYGSMVHYYPPANNRATLIIQTVDEDGVADLFGTLGSGIFASVYGSTAQSTITTRLTPSTLPGNAFGTLNQTVTTAGGNNATGGAIAAGIVALMLEVNPSLSIRDIQHILRRAARVDPLNFDPNEEYFRVDRIGAYLLGQAIPSHWQVNAANIRHSDQHGFGVIDAEEAVNLARTWQNVPRPVVLDTALVNTEGLSVPDATFLETSDTSAVAIPGVPVPIPFCVRDNVSIEAIEVEMTISGLGNNDLMISLVSPYGTHTNLHYPTSNNQIGTTDDLNPLDDDSDLAFQGTNGFAFFQHNFTTFKHWGELSGGRWFLIVQDRGPDDQLSEGTEPTDDDPGEDFVTTFGPLMVPTFPGRTEKSIESYRIKIWGTATTEAPFLGCNPTETSCPGDVNADGVVNAEDLAIFMTWYTTGDLRADVNRDGVLNFADILLFRQLWVPGFCQQNGFPFGRPTSPPSVGPDTPTVRPI